MPASSQAKPLVLLTGATGFIGFRTLVLTLKAGYAVRAAVRDANKASKITENPAIKGLDLSEGRLTFVTIPDFNATRAFDDAIKDVEYVIHLASPIPFDWTPGTDMKTFFIDPAVQGTLGVLESAKQARSVKRIVVTSSAVAIVPVENIQTKTPEVTFNAENRLAVPEDFQGNPRIAYAASKIAALNEAEAWVTREKPLFDVIHIQPSYVLGRNDLATNTDEVNDSTNALVMKLALGGVADNPISGCTVHVDDVARMHVESLKPCVKGNESYLASTPMFWENVSKIVSKNFAEAVDQGILSAQGWQPTRPIFLDTWKTEEMFGRLKNYEEQATSIVGQYVELAGAA